MAVNDGKVPATAQIQGGAHTYAISFTPTQALAHLVHLRFNGENVPGRAASHLRRVPFLFNLDRSSSYTRTDLITVNSRRISRRISIFMFD